MRFTAAHDTGIELTLPIDIVGVAPFAPKQNRIFRAQSFVGSKKTLMDSPCSSPGRGLTATILGTKSDDYTETSVGRLCGFGEVNFEIDAEAIGF